MRKGICKELSETAKAKNKCICFEKRVNGSLAMIINLTMATGSTTLNGTEKNKSLSYYLKEHLNPVEVEKMKMHGHNK